MYNRKVNNRNALLKKCGKGKDMMKGKKSGKVCAKRVLSGAMAAMLVASGVNFVNSGVVQAAGIQPEQDPMKIRFDEPLSKGKLTGSSGNFTGSGSDTDWWQQLSLPIGNSYMGANVYGEVEKEHLTFNQKTLWNGGPSETQPYTGGNISKVGNQSMADYVNSVQNAFLSGDGNASNMCNALVGANTREYGAYQGWGDIYLDFDRVEPPKEESQIIGDNSSQIQYGEGWAAYPQGDWEGGSEHYNNNPGTLTVTFTGTGIQMIGVKGPDMGNFTAVVDNDESTKVSGSMTNSTKKTNQVLFEISGLSYGEHKLTFTSSANGNAKKTSFDCFKVLEGETIDWNPTVQNEKVTFEGQWGRWDRAANNEVDANSWFGKDEVYIDASKAEGATITCKFNGAGFELFGAKSSALGKFQYQVDGGEWKEVNTYDATFARQSLLKVNGLDKTKEHTLTIKGVKNNKISFDGIVTTMKEEAPQKPEDQHTEATNYERALDIDTALATVSYDRDYTHYEREYFASYPDNVIAMKLTAEEIKGSEGEMRPLEFEVSFPVDQPNNASLGKDVTYTTTEDSIVVAGKMKDNGLKMNGRLKVVTKDGEVTPVEGKDGTLLVSNATEAYIYVTADTDYEMVHPTYRTGQTDKQLADEVAAVMDKAVQKGYTKVKEDAQADYKNIYDRVKIDFGQAVSEKTIDDLIKSYKDGNASAQEKAYLETMIFQYGRYLQISSTREGDKLPANLQGVWLDCTGAANSPVAWGSDYHMNVNLQMNYWPTYVTNMAECAEPLIDYVEGLRAPGRITASTYFGIDNSDGKQNGFMANTQNTPFGWTCPGWAFSWGWSPAAVPWILQNVYEAYEYSGDVEKLEAEIFPMLVEEAKFYMSILKEVTDADGTTRYVTIPAYSPEHGPYTAGNVYENVLVWQLFNDCIESAEALNAKKAGTVSAAQIAEWTKFRDGLKPIEIGDSGQIKEWYDETSFGRTANGAISGYDAKHRHMSHLLGVYPGDLVTVENKEYMDAAKVSLTERGDNATGWGIAQRLNTWARTGDGNHAYKIIDQFIRTGIYSNLWDSHAPYQIDGNFGFTSGVAEMLLQSNAGYINLLPAMPDNQWRTGSVSGLVARGNFEVSESWADGVLTEASILSKNGGTCTVQAGDWQYVDVKDSKGNKVAVSGVEGKDGRVTFETVKGENYVLTKTDKPSVVVDKEVLKNKLDEVNTFTNALTETEYTKESIDAYKAALQETIANVQGVYDNENATQDQVNDAVKQLNDKFEDAKKLLEKQGETPEQKVDKSDLQALIAYAQDAKEDASYEFVVPAVKDLLEKALDAAIKVNDNADATQEAVNAAYENLLTKVHLLDFTGNTESLRVLVDLADAKAESEYTAESWAPFAKALDEAKKVLADKNALQTELDAAKAALESAMDGLVKKETVNKDKLAALVKDAEKYEAKLDEYIPSTTEGFVAALQGARDVLANDKATKEEVDAAYTSLQQAMFNLRLKPSKEKLEELLNKVEQMDLTQYSEKTANAVKAAYESAVLVMKNENAKQEEVDAAVRSLQKAIAAADAESKPADKNEASSKPADKESTKKPAKTGDAVNTAVPMLAGFAAILAVLVLRKRK